MKIAQNQHNRTSPTQNSPLSTLRITYICQESRVESQADGVPMWHKIDQALNPVFQVCQNLDRQEWIGVFAVVLTVGYFCMRGFGSRAKY